MEIEASEEPLEVEIHEFCFLLGPRTQGQGEASEAAISLPHSELPESALLTQSSCSQEEGLWVNLWTQNTWHFSGRG